MSLLLRSIERELAFQSSAVDFAVSEDDSSHASIGVATYEALQRAISSCNNDLERMVEIIKFHEEITCVVSISIMTDFISVNKPYYDLTHCQATQVINTLDTTDYDEVADKLFTLSMTIEPNKIKEILAKQA